MTALDVKSFGETWFLEIHTEGVKDALVELTWTATRGDHVKRVFRKGRMPPVLYVDPPEGNWARVDVIVSPKAAADEGASLLIEGYLEKQRLAGVVEGEPQVREFSPRAGRDAEMIAEAIRQAGRLARPATPYKKPLSARLRAAWQAFTR